MSKLQTAFKFRLARRTNKKFVAWRAGNKKSGTHLHHLLESFMGGPKQNDYLLMELDPEKHNRVHYKKQLTETEFIEGLLESLEHVFDYIEKLEAGK